MAQTHFNGGKACTGLLTKSDTSWRLLGQPSFFCSAGAMAQSIPEQDDFDPVRVVKGIVISKEECAVFERNDTGIWGQNKSCTSITPPMIQGAVLKRRLPVQAIDFLAPISPPAWPPLAKETRTSILRPKSVVIGCDLRKESGPN